MSLKPSRRPGTRTSPINIKHLRIIVLSTVIILVLFGEIGKLGIGNLSSVTIAGLTFMSPLEFLEVTLASQTLLPIDAWYAAIAILMAAVVFGRFFCGWICPFALLRIIFRVKERPENNSHKDRDGTIYLSKTGGLVSPANSGTTSIRTPNREKGLRYSVLAGVLGLSALFRIPIFLQFWPIGLFFGFLFAIVRLFSTHQPSLELVVFPALLALELSMKSWCRSICPLGTMLSLTSSLNRSYRPVVNKDACLVAKGVNCQACKNACPEKIDLQSRPRTAVLMNCTKCFDCSISCPVHAISFPMKG